MSELQVLENRTILNEEFTIYGTKEAPLFLAKDVAVMIEYNADSTGRYNTSQMLESIDEDEKIKLYCTLTGVYNEHTPVIPTGSANRWFLTEDGLYEVLMQSRKPIAKEFKKKIKEILKDIRQHGMYATDVTLDNMLNNPDFAITMLTEYKKEKEARLIAEAEVELNKPKIDYYDLVMDAQGLAKAGDIASKFGMTTVKFNKLLGSLGIQFKQGNTWYLYSAHKGKGYVDYPETEYTSSMKWTKKGIEFIIGTLKCNGNNLEKEIV